MIGQCDDSNVSHACVGILPGVGLTAKLALPRLSADHGCVSESSSIRYEWQPPTRAPRVRNGWWMLVLGLVTVGIYIIVWLFNLQREYPRRRDVDPQAGVWPNPLPGSGAHHDRRIRPQRFPNLALVA